ncbi:uncharacterized protein LOC115920927 [Strongylocentrotus purpuratus]|uniref:Uncharacterized protein n=1 Tax=Strongylocentrotus purpuratus TaxID=7668 RepID=A0A7M7NAF7_STRPU|nr:uncharacterized protein LOC115920927 [Strongylocentrotus purpuratus]
MTLWAVNSAGNSSAVQIVASTTPLQPESYGITTSWDKQEHILTLSEANQTLDEMCFITQRTYSGPDCASVNSSECIEPGTEVSIDPDDDTVLVTFGRELCSKPADILTDLSVEKQPSTESNLPYMIIAIGVSAAAGFILLISLGLMYFYGVLCCVKRKKGMS